MADEYGMKMTTELEGRIQIMCNLSENIRERERIEVYLWDIRKLNIKKQRVYYMQMFKRMVLNRDK